MTVIRILSDWFCHLYNLFCIDYLFYSVVLLVSTLFCTTVRYSQQQLCVYIVVFNLICDTKPMIQSLVVYYSVTQFLKHYLDILSKEWNLLACDCRWSFFAMETFFRLVLSMNKGLCYDFCSLRGFFASLKIASHYGCTTMKSNSTIQTKKKITTENWNTGSLFVFKNEMLNGDLFLDSFHIIFLIEKIPFYCQERLYWFYM